MNINASKSLAGENGSSGRARSGRAGGANSAPKSGGTTNGANTGGNEGTNEADASMLNAATGEQGDVVDKKDPETALMLLNPHSPSANLSHPLIPPMPLAISQGQSQSLAPDGSSSTAGGSGSSTRLQMPSMALVSMPMSSMPSLVATLLQSPENPNDPTSDSHPGNNKRPLSTTRRAAQNRSAQKAFRQRKERYIKDLEAQATEVRALKQTIEDLRAENLRLRDYTIALQGRIIELGSDGYNNQAEGGQVYNKMN